jgi:hypothetical protein
MSYGSVTERSVILAEPPPPSDELAVAVFVMACGLATGVGATTVFRVTTVRVDVDACAVPDHAAPLVDPSK